MTLHIGGKKGDIAETVLLPGDPRRARFIAENMLTDVSCYSEIRGMLGFTGLYKGQRISVQGTGMGLPSISIYVNELIDHYGVKNLIRVGSCGSFQKKIRIGDIILVMSSCTESNVNHKRFNGMDFAPTANFELLVQAYCYSKLRFNNIHVGSILSADTFYNENPDEWKIWASYGVLGVEMETSALYTIAAQKQCRALSILTVSDCFLTKEESTPDERERASIEMIELAFAAL